MKAPTQGAPKAHKIAACFPDLAEPEYQQLKASIAGRGQLVPILTYRGEILDGRHRHRACRELGLEPCTQEWDGRGSLLDLVIGLNCDRRHLDASRRAMVAANLANLKPGRPGGKAQICAISLADAAARLHVSERLVQDARKIGERGGPGLAESVARGETTVTAAAAVAGLGAQEQADVVAGGAKAIAARAAEIGRGKKARSTGKPDPSPAPAVEAPESPPDAASMPPARCPAGRPDPAEVEGEGRPAPAEAGDEDLSDPPEDEDEGTIETTEALMDMLMAPLQWLRRLRQGSATDPGKIRSLWTGTRAGRAHVATLLLADHLTRLCACERCKGYTRVGPDTPCPVCKATGLVLVE